MAIAVTQDFSQLQETVHTISPLRFCQDQVVRTYR